MERTLVNMKVLLFLCLLGIIVWVILAAAPSIDVLDPALVHALDRHDQQAVNAVNCFNGGGTISPTMMRNLDNGRSAWMCQMGGDMFIWITEKTGDTVTMFKNRAETFEQAIKYLLNRGYMP
jgi:hypothetical protein